MAAKYSDDRRANTLAALDANGGNVAKTARELGIPRQTIQEWRDGRVPETMPILRQGKRQDLADRLEELARQLADAIPEKIADASLLQVATSMAIALDKMRLLREQATQITRDDSISDEERSGRITALLDAARARRTGPADQPAVH